MTIVHIVAGVLRFGGAALVFFHIAPTMKALGPDPEKFMGRMMNRRRVPDRPDESVPWVVATRETFGRHFDLVVVIWVLALAVAWSVVVLSKANLPADQWSSTALTRRSGYWCTSSATTTSGTTTWKSP